MPGSTSVSYDSLIDDDRQLVDALITCGADMDEPRHVLHYVEVDARSAAERMADLGAQWETSVSPPTADEDTWFVVFERQDRVLSPTNIMADRHLFETMASVHGGAYEGWEACV